MAVNWPLAPLLDVAAGLDAGLGAGLATGAAATGAGAAGAAAAAPVVAPPMLNVNCKVLPGVRETLAPDAVGVVIGATAPCPMPPSLAPKADPSLLGSPSEFFGSRT